MKLISIEGSWVTLELHWSHLQLLAIATQYAEQAVAGGWQGPNGWPVSSDTFAQLAAGFEAMALAGYMQGASTAEKITLESYRHRHARAVTTTDAEVA